MLVPTYTDVMAFPATRMRRLRRTGALRDMVRETELTPRHLVYPMFVELGTDSRTPIESMPGIERLSISHAVEEAGAAHALGITSVLLFGIPAEKDPQGSGAYDNEGVVQLAVRAIKEAHPELVVITDVCMCEYTSHGHCGIVRDDGSVDNDVTLELLAKTAISHAAAGADAVAPSDMMDGRVAALRAQLDARATPRRRSSPTPPSSPRRSTGRSGRPPSRPPRSATGARTRWIRPTRTRPCARRCWTSRK